MSSIAKGMPASQSSQSLSFQADLTEGREFILRLQDALKELSCRCHQSGAMEDLAYFLSRPTMQKKRPVLIRFHCPESSKLMAAVLLYEYRIAGRGTGIFSIEDTTGHRTVVAPPEMRCEFALLAAKELIRRGAHAALISFQHDAASIDPSLESILCALPRGYRWASREREIQGYFPLLSTFDETLAQMGKKTRTQLRYYRRQAEAQLGCVFAPRAEISRAEFLEINRKSCYAVSDELAGWRFDSLQYFGEPVLMGIQDREGRWICVAGGRRYNSWTEIHWLVNREDLPTYSLSTVIRCYLIENEITLGTKRLYFHGGTTHPMKSAFIHEKSTDLLLVRSSAMQALRFFANRMMPEDNMLRNVLLDEAIAWRSLRAR
jgi:hypothetical protein